ncbi:MAG TPA: alpha-1,2-fucosyltransferase [Thermodesulfobacteriota bacterium]|nr:alpha-1,2-fucosyltransferase [Candidatus Paceibacterota bacterium]HVY56172.1 alpha-1,2-fucosyltransferase [Thermodesulfobacteriota bacterium]
MKKIIVRIQGGTGNQLFQYAFARGVSARLGMPYLIDKKVCDDARWDPHKIHRKYSLNLFNTKTPFAEDGDMFGFVGIRKHYKAFDAFYKYLRGKRFFLPFYYPEKTFAYDVEVFARKSSTYFDGDWQGEKYFRHIADELRAEITPVKALSEASLKALEEIKKANAVSLHVRRGDYVTDPLAAEMHGVCSMSYYAAAIAHIEKNVANPHFFIFSDDYAWSVENFKGLKHPVTCIKGTEASDYEDLALMSACKHHIIANSSFGWWGAWLNPRTDKVVVAPKVWFRNAPKADTKDVYAENWIRL